MNELFDRYERELELKFLVQDQKKKFLAQFKNKDGDVKRLKAEVCQEIRKGKRDEETILDLLDELDLHAFTEYHSPANTKTNALIDSLNAGLTGILDYAYNDGFINIRAVLKKNNVLEIENEIAQLNLTFFKSHLDNSKLITQLYHCLMNILQLSNFLEIFDFALDNGDPPQTLSLFNLVLSDPYFKSLFSTSMEF